MLSFIKWFSICMTVRYPHIEKDHLIKLLKQLLLHLASPVRGKVEGHTPNAADVPTLLGSASFSLLDCTWSLNTVILSVDLSGWILVVVLYFARIFMFPQLYASLIILCTMDIVLHKNFLILRSRGYGCDLWGLVALVMCRLRLLVSLRWGMTM